MRIVFMGSGTLGLPTLERLCDEHEVVLVVTQPDRPAGRKRRLTPTPIAAWAAERRLNTIKPEKVGDGDVVEAIDAARPDVIFVAAFGQYIPQKLIAIPRLGEMNLHPSLLPKYRGAAPVNWSLINGETETGNSLIRIAKQMDTGDILAQRRHPVDPRETAGELHDRLAALAPDLVLETLAKMDHGEVEPAPQDDAQAVMAPKLSRDDAWVDFTSDARSIRCRVHGMNPWPSVTATVSGGSSDGLTLKLCRVEDVEQAPGAASPGTLIDGSGLIATGSGAVRVLELQAPGKRVMAWDDFQRGHQLPVGVRFVSGA